MPRNLGLQHLRGLKANIPTLLVGEVYFCTDTLDQFVGSVSGNVRVNCPTYTTAGVLVPGVHAVTGKATVGGGGTITITLSGAAVFTSATSYIVTVTCTNAKHAPQVTQSSGTSFVITSAGGDVVNFICVGN